MSQYSWEQIESIFDKVVELAPNERTAYLDRVCSDNAELRQQIENLLSADDRTDGFIDSPVFTISDLPTDHKLISDAFEGKKLGAYRIIREIGRGGMGTVYLAERDDDEFRKRVAIKLVKRGMDSDFILKRFRNERQILATLEHPNIARLIDGGSTDDGLPFFVMEYVDGTIITEYCRKNDLDVYKRLQLFMSVCSAVEYAHKHSVIHRDLKPGNILVTEDGVPKLLDFGIAKLLDTELAGETIDPTMSFLRMMTPEYASPEQARGQTLTPASDIYSLGVLLYQLITGRRPYDFPSKAPHEITRVICEEDPTPPSKSEGESGQFSTDIDNIILKALSKRREDRYDSAEQFALDIQYYLHGLPITAPVFTRPTGFTTFFKTRPRILFGVIALLLAIVCGVSIYLFTRQNSTTTSEKIDSIAVLPFENASGNAEADYLADGIAESLINSLSQLKDIKVIARSSVFRYKGTTVDPQVVAREMNVRAVLTGKVNRVGDSLIVSAELVDALDNRHVWGEQYNRKLSDLVAIQEDIARQMSIKLQKTLSPADEKLLTKNYSQNAEAYQAYLQGRYYWNKRTPEANREAISHLESATRLDPNFALAYAGLADCYIVAFGYQFMPTNVALARAEDSVQRALSLDNSLGEAHAAHAYIESFGFGHRAEASREFKTALELSPNYATAHQWYAMFLAASGMRDEAISEIERAIMLDPVSLIINSDAVLVYYYAGEYDRGMALCEKVEEMDPKFWIIRMYKGLIYEAQGRAAEAIAEWEAVRVRNPNDQGLTASLGHAYGIVGRRSDAARMIVELDKQAGSSSRAAEAKIFVYAGMHDIDNSLHALETAVKNKAKLGIFFNVDPRLALLRSNPQFSALAAKIEPLQ